MTDEYIVDRVNVLMVLLHSPRIRTRRTGREVSGDFANLQFIVFCETLGIIEVQKQERALTKYYNTQMPMKPFNDIFYSNE